MNYLKLLKDDATQHEYIKLAKKTIIEDLYDKNLKGTDRMVGFEFWEDEKTFMEFGHFVPGCFYIFKYQGEFLRTEDNKEFHDIVPIFLALGVGIDKNNKKPYTFGINFNILTRPIRIAILQELDNMDSNFFNNLIPMHLKGKHEYSKKILKALIKDSGIKFCEYVCAKYKIKKESVAFRKYYYENITKCRLIDYWQWKYIPFIDLQEGVRGYNLKKLQKESIN